MPSPQEFAASIKAKYPQYAEIPDDELVTRVLDKHPVYRDRISQPQAAPEAPQSMGLGEMASSAVGNLPGSAWQFAKDVTAPIHSPIQTAKGLGGLAAGAYERMGRGAKGLALGPEAAQKLKPGENEGSVDALVSFVSERFGGLENIKRTVAEDPAGFLADIAGLAMGGGGLAAKAAGTAGKLGSVAKKVGQAGRAIDPVRLASAGAKGAGRAASTAVSEVLGLTTGASAAPIKVAFRSGKQGGAKSKAFLESIKGDVPMDQVVEEARAAVGNMHKAKMEAYRSGLGSAFKDTAQTPIDFGKVSGTVEKAMGQGRFKGVDISESTSAVRTKIQSRLEQWAKLDPAEFHTVEGMDALRKSIGDVVDSAPYGTPERRLANEVYFSVRKSVEAQAPGYGKVLKGYHEASKSLKNLERGLSLGKNAASETALRKLQAVMRNDVSSAYGKRGEYAAQLVESGAANLEPTLAGQALQPWTPRALASRVGSLGTGVAGASGMISPYALPLVGAASPRVVGMAAHRAGQASRPLSKLAELMAKLPPGTGQASFQAGRAARESRR